MLVVFTNTLVVLEKAIRFLKDSRGKWLKKDQPENFSYEFIKFVLKVDTKIEGGCLTDEERNLYKRLHEIGGLKINHSTTLHVQIPFTSCKTKRPDFKVECRTCHEKRSFTLITDDHSCGMCLAYPGEHWPCSDEHSSYWCECRGCKVHYAVENIKDLNVDPKCHYCRIQKPAPSLKCKSCCNKFLCSTLPLPQEWVCPICSPPSSVPPPEIIEVLLKDFVDGAIDVFAAKSLWSIYEGKIEPHVIYPTVYNGKPIINSEELEKSVAAWIALEKAELGTCMFCFGEMSKSNLSNVCDRRRCGSKACTECLLAWYGEPKPGHILNPGNLTCPFCRHVPSSKILKKYNREICTLKNIPSPWDNSWLYAWCTGCYNAKKYMEKVCHNTNINTQTQYVCEDCATEDQNTNCKECPNCGVMVDKSSGCDHITCVCGSHWCFACSHVSTPDQIYDHMWDTHGNIGLVDDGEYYYSDEEDEY